VTHPEALEDNTAIAAAEELACLSQMASCEMTFRLGERGSNF